MAETTFIDEAVEVFLDVSEMEVTENIGDVVRLDQNRVQEILADFNDDSPQFPILRVEGGLSGNGNNWTEKMLANIAEQINKDEKPGYWGHIPPEQKGYVFPNIETYWLGATVKNEGGKKVLYVKGYNPPESKARKHRRMARLTSWAGKASGKVMNGVRHIETFALESIDWARPGANGMNARVVAWATEMEGAGEVAEVDWAKATLADIERENPSLFTLMRSKIEAEHEAEVSEMKKEADNAKEAKTVFAKLRELLGIEESDDIVASVTEVVGQVDKIGKGELKEKVLTALTKHLKGDSPKTEAARNTVMRLFPVTEMVGKSDDEIEKSVEKFLSEDPQATFVVTEMVSAPAPLARSRQAGDRSGDGDRKDVGRSGMVHVGSTKL